MNFEGQNDEKIASEISTQPWVDYTLQALFLQALNGVNFPHVALKGPALEGPTIYDFR